MCDFMLWRALSSCASTCLVCLSHCSFEHRLAAAAAAAAAIADALTLSTLVLQDHTQGGFQFLIHWAIPAHCSYFVLLARFG